MAKTRADERTVRAMKEFYYSRPKARNLGRLTDIAGELGYEAHIDIKSQITTFKHPQYEGQDIIIPETHPQAGSSDKRVITILIRRHARQLAKDLGIDNTPLPHPTKDLPRASLVIKCRTAEAVR